MHHNLTASRHIKPSATLLKRSLKKRSPSKFRKRTLLLTSCTHLSTSTTTLTHNPSNQFSIPDTASSSSIQSSLPFSSIPKLDPYQEKVAPIQLSSAISSYFQQETHATPFQSISAPQYSPCGIIYHLPLSNSQLDTTPLPYVETENLGIGTSMELTLLGTSSAIPTSTRGLSAVTLKNQGEFWLFDCGPTTRERLFHRSRSTGSGSESINRIFLSHLHADHALGLPEIIIQRVVRSKVPPYIAHRSIIFSSNRGIFAPHDSTNSILNLQGTNINTDEKSSSASQSLSMRATSSPGANHTHNITKETSTLEIFGPLGVSSYVSNALRFMRPATVHNLHFVELIEAFSSPQSLPVGALFFNNLPEFNRCHDYYTLLQTFFERIQFNFPNPIHFSHSAFSNHPNTTFLHASHLIPSKLSLFLKFCSTINLSQRFSQPKLTQIDDHYPHVPISTLPAPKATLPLTSPSQPSQLLSAITPIDLPLPRHSLKSFIKTSSQSIDLQSFLSAPIPSSPFHPTSSSIQAQNQSFSSTESSKNLEQVLEHQQNQQQQQQQQHHQQHHLYQLQNSSSPSPQKVHEILHYPLPNSIAEDPSLLMTPQTANYFLPNQSLHLINRRFAHFNTNSQELPINTASTHSQIFSLSTLQQQPFLPIFDFFISPFWRSLLNLPTLAFACQQFEDQSQILQIPSTNPLYTPNSVYSDNFFSQQYRLPTNHIVTLNPTAPLNLFLETLFLRHLESEWTRIDPLVTYAWAQHDIDALIDPNSPNSFNDIFSPCQMPNPLVNGYTNLSQYIPTHNSYEGDVNTKSKQHLSKSKHLKNHSAHSSHLLSYLPSHINTTSTPNENNILTHKNRDDCTPKVRRSTQISISGVYPVSTQINDGAHFSRPIHFKFKDLSVHAVLQTHSCPSWGWVVEEPHRLKMNQEVCQELIAHFGQGYYLAALNRGIPVAIPRTKPLQSLLKSQSLPPKVTSHLSSLPPLPFSKSILPPAPANGNILALNPIHSKNLHLFPPQTQHNIGRSHVLHKSNPFIQRHLASRGLHLELPNNRDPQNPRKLILPPDTPANFLEQWHIIDPFEANIFTQTDGRKLVLLFDSIGGFSINRYGQALAKNADVLIHESTFSNSGSDHREALCKQHSTAQTAAQFAKHINAKTLVLNHFSTKYLDDTIAGILGDRLVMRYSVKARHAISPNAVLDVIHQEHVRASNKFSFKQATPVDIIDATLSTLSSLTPEQCARYYYDKQQLVMAKFPPSWTCSTIGPNPSRQSLWRLYPQQLQRVPPESVLSRVVKQFQLSNTAAGTPFAQVNVGAAFGVNRVHQSVFHYRSDITKHFDQYNSNRPTSTIQLPISFSTHAAQHVYSIPLINFGDNDKPPSPPSTSSSQDQDLSLSPQDQHSKFQSQSATTNQFNPTQLQLQQQPAVQFPQVRIPSQLSSHSSLTTVRIFDIPDQYATRRTVRDHFLEAAQELDLVKFTPVPDHLISSLNRVSTAIDESSDDVSDNSFVTNTINNQTANHSGDDDADDSRTTTDSEDDRHNITTNNQNSGNNHINTENLSNEISSDQLPNNIISPPSSNPSTRTRTKRSEDFEDDEDDDTIVDEERYQSLYRGRDGVFLPGSSLLSDLRSARRGVDFASHLDELQPYVQTSTHPARGVQNLLVGHDGMILRLDRSLVTR